MKGWLRLWSVCLLASLTLPAYGQKTVQYFHTDALGSVVAVTDASGAPIERREYEPYGAQLTPAVQGGPGYTGHVQDAATGLVYMQQRYYDSACGSFLSADPVTAYGNPISQFHRYRYANNNPYKLTDPDGRVAVVTNRRDGSILVEFPAKFSGSGATQDNINAIKDSVSELSGVYEINGKETSVEFRISDITKDTPRAARNSIRLTDGPTNSRSGLCNAEVGGRRANINVQDRPGPGGTAVHEFLHLAGAKDKYDVATRRPNPDWGNNIMNV